ALPVYALLMTPEAAAGAERGALGQDHASAGAWLARRWRYPERLVELIERHHDIDASGDVLYIRLANMLVHFAHGRSVDLSELGRVAERIGIARAAVGDLMYELPASSQPSRRVRQPCPLSDRELDVLRLLGDGHVYKQIALELDLSPSTVRSHL